MSFYTTFKSLISSCFTLLFLFLKTSYTYAIYPWFAWSVISDLLSEAGINTSSYLAFYIILGIIYHTHYYPDTNFSWFMKFLVDGEIGSKIVYVIGYITIVYTIYNRGCDDYSLYERASLPNSSSQIYRLMCG